MKKLIWVLAVMLSSLLTACGGSGSSGTVGGGSATTVSGVVMDGYLVGATIFSDCNSNLVLDAGEVSTISTAGGAFTLEGPTVAQCSLVANIDLTVVDEDTGSTVTRAYQLTAPAGMWSVVSPYTTLIEQALKTDNTLTIDDVRAALNAGLIIPGTEDISGDYVASGSTHTHDVAKVIVATLAELRAALKSAAIGLGYTDEPTLDEALLAIAVERLFSNLSDISLFVTATSGAIDAATADSIATDIVANENAVRTFAGNIVNEVEVTRSLLGYGAQSPFTPGLVSGKSFFTYDALTNSVDKITLAANGTTSGVWGSAGIFAGEDDPSTWEIDPAGHIIIPYLITNFTTYSLIVDTATTLETVYFDSSQAGPIAGDDGPISFLKSSSFSAANFNNTSFAEIDPGVGATNQLVFTFNANGAGDFQATPLDPVSTFSWSVLADGSVLISFTSGVSMLVHDITAAVGSQVPGAIHWAVEERDAAGALTMFSVYHLTAL